MSRLDVLLRQVHEVEGERAAVLREMDQAARLRRWREWDELLPEWDALTARLGPLVREMAALTEGLSWPRRPRDHQDDRP